MLRRARYRNRSGDTIEVIVQANSHKAAATLSSKNR